MKQPFFSVVIKDPAEFPDSLPGDRITLTKTNKLLPGRKTYYCEFYSFKMFCKVRKNPNNTLTATPCETLYAAETIPIGDDSLKILGVPYALMRQLK